MMKTKIGITRIPHPRIKEKAILNFGKYEGEYVEDAPVEYLQWLVNQPMFREQHKNLSKEIDKVLNDSDLKPFSYEQNFDDDDF